MTLKISIHTMLFMLYFCKSSADVNSMYYPRYHLAPPYGWMNDPNGFSYFNNEYHLFYQHNPNSSMEPGITHWGHAKSTDLFHWEHLPIAMYPDQWFDMTGVFSGSAIVENDTMYFFYTGNLNHANEEHDHEQYQALASSADGVNVIKYKNNPVINGSEHQPNIRDPKVWKHEDTYYMVIGNSFNNNTLGRVLLYSSKDMISWEQVSVLAESDGMLGYMWECPDFFEINGLFVLLFSPQGIEPESDKYNNLFQTGYIVGTFDYVTHRFNPISKFKELDHGHDFYATQTFLDSQDRRILIAWFSMWEQNYPERIYGWAGQMTIPRELTLSPENDLIQKPVEEIAVVRDNVIYTGKNIYRSEAIALNDNTGEITLKARPSSNIELFIESEDDLAKLTISYDYNEDLVILDRGGDDGVRRTQWKPIDILIWNIFIDASSIELFCGYGEVTFSSRFFPSGNITVRLSNESFVDEIIVATMKRTVPVPED
ncbi:sucrose-6-phosphate hydrolase-like [Galleria mellonella]|uniref:Sucrose-6-phosphate hydrolase n=1 Tax=Galleria mellonella TaxID=7137 RepID=A0A6J1X5N8_GALME|nr:sucrose-6-phosphate hydrolase-like [Galleria mellonella]